MGVLHGDKESLEAYLSKRKIVQDYFVGVIKRIEERVVSDADTAAEYGLQLGTVYYEVHAKAMSASRKSTSTT